MLKFLFCISTLFLYFHGYSQNSPCETEKHHQFDFWIGEWEVADSSGKVVGNNTITKDYKNCLIQEKWESTTTNRGTSYNYYNPKDSSWNQVWIDNQGSILNLKGAYNGSSMELKSAPFLSKNNKMLYHQISWKAVEENKVIQHWEVFDTNGVKKSDLFYGIYKRK